jgi:beta-lactam-binding protein with PASTA domain
MVGAGAGVAGAGPATGQVPYAGPDEPKKRTGLFVGLLVVLLVLIAGVLFFVGRNLGQSKANVDVPGVVGMNIMEASSELTSAGFEVDPEPVESERPEGEVLTQDPGEGTKAEEGSTIRLTYSGGLGQVEVPDVTGLTQAAAEAALREKDLVPVVVTEPSDDVDEGEVISQSPAARVTVDKRSEVEIRVSSGVAPVEVPNLVGDDATSASNQLGVLGLRVATTRQSSETVPADQVISQNPAPGSELAKGETVNLVISTGPAPTTTTSTSTTTSTTTTTTTTEP